MEGESFVERQVAKQIGRKLAKLMVSKAGSRVLGHIARHSRVREKALNGAAGDSSRARSIRSWLRELFRVRHAHLRPRQILLPTALRAMLVGGR
jgi:hypothetical protein